MGSAATAADAAKNDGAESDVLLWMCPPTAALPDDAPLVDLLLTDPNRVAAVAHDEFARKWGRPGFRFYWNPGLFW